MDVNDQASIRNMCEQAKIVINCVGPVKLLKFYGLKLKTKLKEKSILHSIDSLVKK